MVSLNLKKITLFFILFLTVYQINFSFLPLSSTRLVLLAILPFAIFNIEQIKRILFNKTLSLYLLVNFLFFLHILLTHSIKGFLNNALVVFNVVFFTTSIMGSILISSLLIKYNVSRLQLLKTLQLVFFIQSVFIILTFASPTLKLLIADYIPYSEASNLSDESYRSRGLTNSSGATLSLLQSFGLFLSAYLYTTVSNKLYSTYLILSFAIITISLMTVGRTGLISLAFIPFIFTLTSKKSLNFLIFIPVLSFFAFTLFQLTYSLLSGGYETQFGADAFESMTSWVFNEVSNDDGDIKIRTVSALLNDHLVFSNDLILGNPNLWTGQFAIRTDIGYVRILNTTGIVGFSLFYGSFLLLFRHLISLSNSRTEKKLFFTMLLFLLLTDAKEPFLSKIYINSFLLLIYTFYIGTSFTKRYTPPHIYR